MQISAFSYKSQRAFPAPRFGIGGQMMSARQLQKPDGSRPYQTMIHCTYILRDLKVLQSLSEELLKRFPQGVTIQMHGGSTGAEAESMALILASAMGPEQARKYPILAGDLQQEALDVARLGVLSDVELEKYAESLGPQVREWVEPTHLKEIQAEIKRNNMEWRLGYEITEMAQNHESFYQFWSFGGLTRPKNQIREAQLYRFKPVIRDMISYRQADILQSYKTRESAPAVHLFRNAWYQIPHAYQRNQLVKDLARNLHPDSLLVVGDCEYGKASDKSLTTHTHRTLQHAGFMPLTPYQPEIRYDDQPPGIKIFKKCKKA